MRLDLKTPTIAEAFSRAGFETGGFIAAFPLDRRFGLIKGFQTYGDAMPRDAGGRTANDRPGRAVVDAAIEWLAARRAQRFFLWVHLFEPHAPYGDPARNPRPAIGRYDDDIAEADREVGRLLETLGDLRAGTLIVLTSDHGEAFGEHGEISHSLFAYDTTLRVPLILAGPQVPAGTVVADPVSLVDVAPTIAALARLERFDGDGRTLPTSDLRPPTSDLRAPTSAPRTLYAETFAPLLDFGWSPLRTVRNGDWKYIAAPTPELYDLKSDPAETRNLAAAQPARASDLARQVEAMSTNTLTAAGQTPDRETLARLQALGYAAGGPGRSANRPDPKDRREIAARFASVASGELRGAALERALREILRADATNPQANVRLGYVLLESGRCAEAIPRFTAAIAAHLPSADAHLGRAACEIAAKHAAAAERTLGDAQQVEPDNPVAYGRTGKRAEASREAQELLRRLPSDAPQRPEVERLLTTVRQPAP
jgi:arylsulfatase A-like enzyme